MEERVLPAETVPGGIEERVLPGDEQAAAGLPTPAGADLVFQPPIGGAPTPTHEGAELAYPAAGISVPPPKVEMEDFTGRTPEEKTATAGGVFTPQAEKFMERTGVTGEARFDIGRLANAGTDPSQFYDDETGRIDQTLVKQHLRATDPEYAAEEFGKWMNSDVMKQADLDFRRMLSGQERGGTQVLKGRYAGDPARAYAQFRGDAMDQYANVQKRQDDLYINNLVERGKISAQQASVMKTKLEVAGRENTTKMKEAGAAERQAADFAEAATARGWKAGETEKKRVFDAKWNQKGFEHDFELAEAKMKHDRGMSDDQIKAEKDMRDADIQADIKKIAMKEPGEIASSITDSWGSHLAKLNKARTDAAMEPMDAREQREAQDNFMGLFRRNFFVAKNPGVSKIAIGNTPEGNRILYGIVDNKAVEMEF